MKAAASLQPRALERCKESDSSRKCITHKRAARKKNRQREYTRHTQPRIVQEQLHANQQEGQDMISPRAKQKDKCIDMNGEHCHIDSSEHASHRSGVRAVLHKGKHNREAQ